MQDTVIQEQINLGIAEAVKEPATSVNETCHYLSHLECKWFV